MGLIETIRFRIIPSLSSNWKTYVLVLLPLILLPLPVLGNGKEARTGYVIIIMAIYWMTEALPVPITSLLPVVLFPLLGIMDTGKVCTAYMKETNMMFIGGLMVALAIEHCNLHKRTALRVLLLVGASPRWLMLGFMLVTMFLSMWISNTATTAMMVPIVEAVVEELFKENEGVNAFRESPVTSFENTSVDMNLSSENVDCCIDTVGSIDSVADVGKSCLELTPSGRRSTHNPEHKKKIGSGVFMSIAYASNIGGTGSLIGSGPQLALKGILNELYGPAPGLNFASWMAFNIPGMLINTFLAWIWLQYLFIGFKRTTTDEDGKTKVVKNLIKKKYEELGPMTFHEIATLILFIVCVFLWFFRDPQFITGWSEYLHAVEVDDATAVMTIVMFLFIIPAKPKIWWFRNVGGEVTQFSESCSALLEWKYVQDKLPWGVVLLLGGGFAISDASKISGLSTWLGAQLSVLSVLPPFIIMLTICIMTAAVTEVASNTATANILLPILSEMANTIQVNPLFLMLPATVTCSYAFMLPVATPPNAIVFAAGKMNQVDMMKTGFFMNIICVFTICVLTVSYGSFMFGFEKFPEWALPKLIMNDTMTQMILRSNHTL